MMGQCVVCGVSIPNCRRDRRYCDVCRRERQQASQRDYYQAHLEDRRKEFREYAAARRQEVIALKQRNLELALEVASLRAQLAADAGKGSE